MDMATDLKEKWICPNCGADMNPKKEENTQIYICPDCGCTIDGENKDYGEENICPNCYQILDGNECPHCGYDLGSDFD